MPSIARRKTIELANKLASLDAEILHWHEESAEGGPLEKHHTQVRAVSAQLGVPIDELRCRIERLDARSVLTEGATVEEVVLDLHRVWDTFRSKLALRYVDHFAGFLVGADELAYRCYYPAEKRGAPREPPLSFFGDDVSPLTRTRGSGLAPRRVADRLREPLRRLPVPLIGVPWFQIEHLPDAPIIAHEVGHDVEADLALGPPIDVAIDGALAHAGAADAHRRAWATWRAEVFADVFGTLALGPAFTSTLIDFLADDPGRIADESQHDPDWSMHPPSALRVLVSVETLQRMADEAYAADAAQLRADWSQTYPEHAMSGFDADVPVVTNAVLDGPYEALGNGRLTELLEFSPEAHERAQRDAREVPNGFVPRGTDARELVAAARLAFDRAPEKFRAAQVSKHVLSRIREAQTVGTRAGTDSTVAQDVRDARAVEAGRWLLDYLTRSGPQRGS